MLLCSGFQKDEEDFFKKRMLVKLLITAFINSLLRGLTKQCTFLTTCQAYWLIVLPHLITVYRYTEENWTYPRFWNANSFNKYWNFTRWKLCSGFRWSMCTMQIWRNFLLWKKLALIITQNVNSKAWLFMFSSPWPMVFCDLGKLVTPWFVCS